MNAALNGVLPDLARFVVDLGASDIPASAMDRARMLLLDVIGCAAGGQGETAPVACATWSAATFASGECSVWFSPNRLNLVGAVMSNCGAASAMDGDDTHPASFMHSGSAIVPAAVAAAEEVGASGEDLLRAVVIGYEVTCRVAAAVDWPAMKQIATGHWCGFGAAAAVGWLRGLSAKETAHAFGVVAGLRPQVYAPDDKLNLNGIKEGIAWGTFTGIAALELAGAGLTGPEHALDHPLFNAAVIRSGGGEGWAVEQTRLKPYASCAATHAATDVLVELLAEHGLRPDEITKVTVATSGLALGYINNEADPQTFEAAQYNIPFTQAVAAVDGVEALFPLRESTLHRADLVAFASKVHLEIAEGYEDAFAKETPAFVILETSRGTFYGERIAAVGPDSLDMVIRKFRRMATPGWNTAQQERMISAVQALRGDLGPFLDAIRTPFDIAAQPAR